MISCLRVRCRRRTSSNSPSTKSKKPSARSEASWISPARWTTLSHRRPNFSSTTTTPSTRSQSRFNRSDPSAQPPENLKEIARFFNQVFGIFPPFVQSVDQCSLCTHIHASNFCQASVTSQSGVDSAFWVALVVMLLSTQM